MRYKVIVIDDSPFFRDMLAKIINDMEDFEVVDTAVDAYDAREKIKLHEPDLVTIDINMPKMDGVTFLRNLMRLHPMPSIIITTDPTKHLEVFEDGAIGYVQKVVMGEESCSFEKRVQECILSYSYLYERYSKNKPQAKTTKAQAEHETKLHPDLLLPKNPAVYASKKIIAIGSSTGGIEALTHIFAELVPPLPPIVVAQHIPFGFSKSFAKRLNNLSRIEVFEADSEMELQESCAYIAPGNKHLITERESGTNRYIVKPIDGVRISRHKPSVDVLFRSVNNTFGRNSLAIIMTGMGDDGALCIKEIKESGGYTVAQDESSSVVFGMAKKAIETGGVKDVVPLKDISKIINSF